MAEGAEGKEREDIINDTKNRLVALGSDQAHSSTAKAALIAGVRYKAISVSMKNNLALTGEALQLALNECADEDLLPFYLTANLGTTGTCAVDCFEEIKDILASEIIPPMVWLHIDAAYAGSALVLEEYAHLTTHFAHFDSFDVNMHKWLLTNFDASCLFVRRRLDLTSALNITPSFLQNPHSDSGLVTDYRDWQIPLGRRFRALKIWFVLRTYGVNGIKAILRKHIALGETFAGWIRGRADLFRILTPPAFALTVITLAPQKRPRPRDYPSDSEVGVAPDNVLPATKSDEQERLNELTKKVYERINEAGELYLTSSLIRGVYAIRVVSANEKANEDSLRKAFEILVRTSEDVIY